MGMDEWAGDDSGSRTLVLVLGNDFSMVPDQGAYRARGFNARELMWELAGLACWWVPAAHAAPRSLPTSPQPG